MNEGYVVCGVWYVGADSFSYIPHTTYHKPKTTMPEFAAIIFTTSPDPTSSVHGAMVKVDSRECLLRSIELFLNRENLPSVIVGLNPDQAEEIKRKVGSHLMILGAKAATAGPGWREQLAACLEKVPASVTHILVHDAARPVISSLDIDALIEQAEKHDAIALVAPTHTTLLQLDETGTVLESLPGKSLRQLFWTFAFKRKVFEEVIKSGLGAVHSRLHLLDASPLSMRVNSAGDASLAKAHINLLPKPKTKASTNPFEEAQW